MEIAVEEEVPTYSGGLGILAGDTIRSAADLELPMVAVTLLHRKGYFRQKLLPDGWQVEEPAEWIVEDFLQEVPGRASVTIEDRKVHVRSWKYEVAGIGGFNVPVYFLDTDLPENCDWDRELTHFLYGGDHYYRFCQEVVLGIGGVRILRALGHESIQRFHMNEGHAGFLTLELLDEEMIRAGRHSVTHEDIDAVRSKCVFTTHTPVPAGHDQFPVGLFDQVFRQRPAFLEMKDFFYTDAAENFAGARSEVAKTKPVLVRGSNLNMTYLGLNLSHYVNGVAKKHGEVSSLMFSGYEIDAITNGVHAHTWVSEHFKALFDRYIPGWKQDNFTLRYALSIPGQGVWEAHMQAKRELVRYVSQQTGAEMNPDVLTIGFARRATAYKRFELLFTDIEKLRVITSKAGPFQIIYAGKAHPHDQNGKEAIRRIFQVAEALKQDIRIAYLEGYDMKLAKMMTSGVDLWLNTPQPPLEASGTSGMKAALNGVPSLSVLDGWWIEGHIEGITGWAVGENGRKHSSDTDVSKDASSLYSKLENVIIPTFYRDRSHYVNIMRHSIALNGSFFNAQRMLQQYVLEAYFM